MAAQPSNTALEPFCTTYLKLGGDLAGLAKVFLIAALVAAVVAVVIEAIKALQAPVGPRAAPAPTAIKDLAEALKSLITALSSAPVWLALFGAGVLLFWVPGNAVEVCRSTTGQSTNGAAPPRQPGSGSTRASTNPETGNTQVGQ